MQNIFFTADTHFGHANIIKYCHRPFLCRKDQEELKRRGNWHDGSWKGSKSSKYQISKESVNLMDNTILDNINSLVQPNDILYHLGDFAFGDPIFYRKQIKCKNIFFIYGNHDKNIMYDNQVQTYFTWCKHYHELNIDGQLIVLMHYAMRVWNKSHRGSYQLYGHSHGSLPDDPHARSFDVGVDCHNYKPITFEQIVDIMNTKDWKPIDHHE